MAVLKHLHSRHAFDIFVFTKLYPNRIGGHNSVWELKQKRPVFYRHSNFLGPWDYLSICVWIDTVCIWSSTPDVCHTEDESWGGGVCEKGWVSLHVSMCMACTVHSVCTVCTLCMCRHACSVRTQSSFCSGKWSIVTLMLLLCKSFICTAEYCFLRL